MFSGSVLFSFAELADHEGEHMTPVNKNGYFKVNEYPRRPSASESVYSAISDPPIEQDARTPMAVAHEFSHANASGYSGLGIDASQQDDVDLEELKVSTVPGLIDDS